MREAAEQERVEVECCVLCGRETEYTRQTLIQDRIGYIEGAGQLCSDCFKELYLGRKEHHG